MKLIDLRLRNFKGIQNFELNADGQNLKIFGDNATGKTTLFDAFLWLLFDKDSNNRKDFEIKTLENGKPIHGLEHEVEGCFEINGERVTFRKIYAEKWTKQRGSAEATFSGHTTDYFIDDVPTQKREFDARISAIADETVFRLLTNPSYFNEQLKWQDRRKTLLDICGDLTDQEVIEGNKALVTLPAILGKKTIQDHRKIITARRSEINSELDKIPVRIAEIQRGLPDLSDLNQEILIQEKDVLAGKLTELRNKHEAARVGGGQAEITIQIREIESQLLDLNNRDREAQEEVQTRNSAKRREWQVEQQKILDLKFEIETAEKNIRQEEEQAKDHEAKRERLRNEWSTINAEELPECQDSVCPTCNQIVSQDINALREAFNLKKSEKLAANQVEGKALRERLDEITLRITKEKEALELKKAQLEKIELLVKPIVEEPLPESVTVAEREALNVKRTGLENQQMNSEESKKAALDAIQSEISEVEAQVKEFDLKLLKFDSTEESRARIKELEEQQKKLGAEYERLEQELYLTEEFIRTKVNLLEERINARFKNARFKLFETQVNGGLAECCETTFNGVPYSSGLNNAARINVGLDIINTLSEHYGFTAPIFVDNREAVTQLIDVNAQVISLIVSGEDKKLRIEREG